VRRTVRGQFARQWLTVNYSQVNFTAIRYAGFDSPCTRPRRTPREGSHDVTLEVAGDRDRQRGFDLRIAALQEIQS
jgi:hypothetical protein